MPEEEQQHEEGEHGADEPGLAQLGERGADAVCLVRNHQDLDTLKLRQLACGIDGLDHPIGDVDHVRLGGLVNVDADRGSSVHASADGELRGDEFHGRDVPDADATANDQVSHVVERVEFAQRANDEA